jgi:predicted RNA binding protein YcfA (HicA-like mRNA interferase family)
VVRSGKSRWRSDLPKIAGVPHLRAVRALEKTGFKIAREGKHIVMSNGMRFVTIPRNNPVNAHTMGGIARDAGLTVDEFKKLL